MSSHEYMGTEKRDQTLFYRSLRPEVIQTRVLRIPERLMTEVSAISIA